GDVELSDVLARDVRVGTDVHDVDSLDLVPEMVDHPRDQTSGDHSLTQSRFVSDQKPMSGVAVDVHTPEDIRHCIPLKVLQALEHIGRVWPSEIRGPCTRACRAAQTASPTAPHPP